MVKASPVFAKRKHCKKMPLMFQHWGKIGTNPTFLNEIFNPTFGFVHI